MVIAETARDDALRCTISNGTSKTWLITNFVTEQDTWPVV